MRVIKPYGRSHVKNEAEQKPRRTLHLNPDFTKKREVPNFAENHDALVIAQWISVIDKIISKPKNGKKAKTDRHDKREKLGEACWTLICDKGLLNQNLLEGIDPKTLWNSKIHPYKGAEKTEPNNAQIEGRWFNVFIGNGNGKNFDASAVAQKIYEHLYISAYSFRSEGKRKPKGAIAHRADSINVNVLKPQVDRDQWAKAEAEEYKNKGDIAGIIYQGIEAANTPSAGKHFGIAMDALRKQYADVFGDIPIKSAQEQAGLFALHEAVKAYYKGLLKRHKKGENILNLLPKDNDELIKLIKKKQGNRDLNHLIRLGKIIHYQAGLSQTDTADTTAAVLSHWPNEAEIENSLYWGSDGQAEIKRNEAFVRIWRHVLSLMQRTATDWADPNGCQDSDILSSTPINAVTGDAFPQDTFDSKLKLLFGSRADIFLPSNSKDDDSRKAVLKAALRGLGNLRNGAFHFKGLRTFANGLKQPHADTQPINDKMAKLWNQDVKGRRKRLIDTLRAADAEGFLEEWQAKELMDALTKETTPLLALPRFNRIIERAKNTGVQNLPKPVNRKIMEESAALRCQYICLKLLYERPFRHYLETAPKDTLNHHIDTAVKRATKAAKVINGGKGDSPERDLIFAKVDRAGKLTEDDKSINDYFYRLSALTASDFGVQQGYESDGEKAKTQAETIENFKCEIIARAFDDWLRKNKFNFLTKLSNSTQKSSAAGYTLEDLPKYSLSSDGSETWQHSLYFLLHLAPVDAVSKLLHQIRKWQVLAKNGPGRDNPDDAKPIAEVLNLYLDMHDAKFEGGGEALYDLSSEFRNLFDRPDDIDRVFKFVVDTSQSKDGKPDDDRCIPIRGLREILRFGHMKPLQQIYETHKIRTDDIEKLERLGNTDNGRSTIDKTQAERENLHKKLVRQKNKNSNDIKEYRDVLQKVIEHRHLSAHIYLVNHVRLHWLMMAVLGRLVDYAGLFERDLYFTLLGLAWNNDLPVSKLLNKDGRSSLKSGQILNAIKNFNGNEKKSAAAKDSILNYFGPVWDDENGRRKHRNGFAHFNMLHGDKQPNLTQLVNDARSMMAYDRKLKNAVSKSIKDLLKREGLTIKWSMTESHMLESAVVETACAYHLGTKKNSDNPIGEALHGDPYVNMVAKLFNGQATPAKILCYKENVGEQNAQRGIRKGQRRKPKNAGRKSGHLGGFNAHRP